MAAARRDRHRQAHAPGLPGARRGRPERLRLTGFDEIPLSDALRRAVADLGFTTPTPIQAAALPVALAGRDLLGQAATGTGKTLAFGLPLLQRVDLSLRRVQGLVLCPTRELAMQVTADLRAAGKRCPGLRVLPLTGGAPREPQARSLGEGAHVCVGTPGRLLDHLRRGALDLSALRVLVLDEADRMLELGFAPEVDAIGSFVPAERQTLLFSATFPPSIAALSARWQRDPARVVVEAQEATVDARFAAVDDPGAALEALLRALQPESALVFCNFKRVAAETAAALAGLGHAAAALHGDVDQVDRDRVMAAFRNGSVRVLVATDLAARGLDVQGLPLVVNLGLPDRGEDYLHRIGRTGRAGAPGLAWSLVARDAALPEGAALSALPGGDGPPLGASWVTLRLGAGRRDKLRPGDLLGALTGDCGLEAAQVGRFEIHDRQAFVAIAADAAATALRGLSRHGVKGRRVRVERVPLG